MFAPSSKINEPKRINNYSFLALESAKKQAKHHKIESFADNNKDENTKGNPRLESRTKAKTPAALSSGIGTLNEAIEGELVARPAQV